MGMRLGAKGATFIKGYETGGKRPTKTSKMILFPRGEPALETYFDDVGVPTIGWGHTGKGVVPGLKITLAQAEAFFAADVAYAETFVDHCVAGHRTTQDQFDAMVSLAFNIGNSAFLGSTVLRKHLAGDYAGAEAAFASWNKGTVKGKKVVLSGLVTRRAGEAAIYLGSA